MPWHICDQGIFMSARRARCHAARLPFCKYERLAKNLALPDAARPVFLPDSGGTAYTPGTATGGTEVRFP